MKNSYRPWKILTIPDSIFGNEGADNLIGNSGDALIHGNAGNDSLKGGQGSDTLTGSNGFEPSRVMEGMMCSTEGLVMIYFVVAVVVIHRKVAMRIIESSGCGSDIFILETSGENTISDFSLGKDFIRVETDIRIDRLELDTLSIPTEITLDDQVTALIHDIAVDDLIRSSSFIPQTDY